ncbi:hypothetical protein L1987_74604 [Smallanthus sonchifolius]|uniref:Uncharacterized protein n=1 Tax=Smallanthus sonchifolius TaxID=185202 RepID=A0ACB9A3T8_9ASTR|nr:hypothetical protein L1987_74604 [Smallanthus sonchifolius]
MPGKQRPSSPGLVSIVVVEQSPTESYEGEGVCRSAKALLGFLTSFRLVTDQLVSTARSSLRDELAFFRV